MKNASSTVEKMTPLSKRTTKPSGLNDLLGYQLKRAQIVLQRDFLVSLAPLKLTQRQGAILWLIKENPAISQSELANILLMDRATMLAIIEKLSKRGLVQRKKSEVDRRRHELCLTDKGVSLLAKSKVLIQKHEEGFKKLFTEKELTSLFKLLKVLANHT